MPSTSFNSPSLPGLEEFSGQIANVTGLNFDVEGLDQVGLNIMGVERMINARLGVRRCDDTLPDRWFNEEIGVGAYKTEKIDRHEFDQLLSRFYEISHLNTDGVPIDEWRRELESVLGA